MSKEREDELRKYNREWMRERRKEPGNRKREQKRENNRRRAKRLTLRCFGCGKVCKKRIWRTVEGKRLFVGYCGKC